MSAAHYTIESTPSLNPAAWTSFEPHTNLTGFIGDLTRSIPVDCTTNRFFRIRIE